MAARNTRKTKSPAAAAPIKTPGGVEQKWSAETIQALMTHLGKHQGGHSQQDFLRACKADPAMVTTSGDPFTDKQIMSKARGISKKARDAGYKCDVPRLARGGIIDPNGWEALFKKAKLKKA